jgi:Spy/CpxP family protein refolding chaperone
MKNMKNGILGLLAALACAPCFAADAPAAKPAAAPAAPTTEQLLEQFRTDLQAKSADVMAKGMTLTADQAAKFWPLFEQFQKEQGAIVDGQMKATQQFAEKYTALSDADAQAYITALLDRDGKMQDLRVKWLKKFQDVVPAKIAARAIQIDRRLGQVTQVKMSSQIPLIK